MNGDQLALWIGIAAGVIAVVGVVVKVCVGVVRRVKGRVVRHREKVVRQAIQPLFDERAAHVDSELAAIRHSQEELSSAIGTTTRRVTDLEVAITNGITEDVADMKTEQVRVGKRIDKIYDHLID